MSRKRRKGKRRKSKEEAMQVLYSYSAHGCRKHPEIVLKGGGKITGGKSVMQSAASDMWIMLDAYPIEAAITCIDSTAKFSSSTHKRVILFPIDDRKTPKDEELFDKLLEEIDIYVKAKKHVHISCIGVHGRTGMMIAAYLGKYYKIPDPVKYVREIYCKKAVESYEQHALVHKISGIEAPSKKLYAPVIREDDPWLGYTFQGYGGFQGRSRVRDASDVFTPGRSREHDDSDRFTGTTMEDYDSWYLRKYGEL